MPRLSKAALLEQLTTGLAEGGWRYLILSRDHPFELLIYAPRGESYRTRVYIWNITHGGGAARAATEYRIQITSGVTRFNTAGVDRTLILGWWDSVGVFAGFDVAKHLGVLGASPSLQIHEEALRLAAERRVATYRKANDEIAIAFVPSFLGEYTRDLLELHNLALSERDVAVLEAVAEDPADPSSIENATTGERMRVLRQVAQQLRDSSFGERVLTAYSRSCAICAVQLRVVDAAHIVPAEHVNDDATSNGIGLCATHHRAFDRALVTVLPDYSVAVNPAKLDDLRRKGLDGGWSGFYAALRPQILLPPDNRDRPNRVRLEQANTLRGWVGFERVA